MGRGGRVFLDADADACARGFPSHCGGLLRLIATFVDPRTIRARLLSFGVRAEVADLAPPAFGALA